MATSEGRITLSDMKLVITRNGRKEERLLGSEEEREGVLRLTFGVVL
jgi:N-hydroxyarylamine O-acetyltransferase